MPSSKSACAQSSEGLRRRFYASMSAPAAATANTAVALACAPAGDIVQSQAMCVAPAMYMVMPFSVMACDPGPQFIETDCSIALACIMCIEFSLLKHLYVFDSYVTVSTVVVVALAHAASHTVAVHPSYVVCDALHAVDADNTFPLPHCDVVAADASHCAVHVYVAADACVTAHAIHAIAHASVTNARRETNPPAARRVFIIIIVSTFISSMSSCSALARRLDYTRGVSCIRVSIGASGRLTRCPSRASRCAAELGRISRERWFHARHTSTRVVVVVVVVVARGAIRYEHGTRGTHRHTPAPARVRRRR